MLASILRDGNIIKNIFNSRTHILIIGLLRLYILFVSSLVRDLTSMVQKLLKSDLYLLKTQNLPETVSEFYFHMEVITNNNY